MAGSPLDSIPAWGAQTLQNFDGNIQDGQRVRGNSRQYVKFYNKTFTELVVGSTRTNPRTGEVTVLTRVPKERTVEMVHIKTPGDKNEVDDCVTDYHRREYWLQYQAFRSGKTAPLGKMLEECDFVPPQIALELKVLGCHTLEQLADASDLLANQIPSGWELRVYAQAMVASEAKNKDSGEIKIVSSALDAANAQIAELQRQMAQLVNSQGETISSGKVVDEPLPIVGNVEQGVGLGPVRPKGR